MNKKCYVVGAGDNSGTIFYKNTNEYIIAADAGIEVLKNMNITPDLTIGDFDSLGYVPKGDNIIVYNVEKDDTDMMLAVGKALELGYNDIEIFGGTGGRIDHTIANFQTMLMASKHGAQVKMIDSRYIYRMITNESIVLDKKESGDVSIFAFGGGASGVTITGGKYEAEEINLFPNNPTAVSNSFVGKPINISVDSGSLLIIYEK